MAKKKAATKTKVQAKADPGSPPSLAPLPSLQSMESFFGDLFGFGGRERTPLDEAQDLIYDAWEAPTPQQAAKLARKALEISPDCADAYVVLAQMSARSADAAVEFFRKGVEAGERALGERAFQEDVGHFWGILETRPYMRARQGLASLLWQLGRTDEAVEHYRELLRLNPDDNQGIRELLMPCLIELGRDRDARELWGQHADDGSAAWAYAKALLDFREHGAGGAAKKSLRKALSTNRHIPDYLLGRKKPPKSLPAFYGMGDDNEAVLYVDGQASAWSSSPGALEWLAGPAGR